MNAPIPEDLREDYEWAQGDETRCRDEHLITLIERIAALQQERDQLQSKLALLTDPAAVHVNILRGTLPLTKAQAIHIAGLPADVEQEMERLQAEVERLSAVLKSIECASCGGNNLKHKRGCEQAVLARRKP